MKEHHNPILLGVVSRIRQVLEKFDESSVIKHAGTKGSLREAYLRQFLSEFVSLPFELKSGFITDCRGAEISPQIDLLVFDRTSVPAFALSDFVSIIPLEAARLAIEVKSLLKSDDLAQIQIQQNSLRRMRFAWATAGREYLQTFNCLGISQFVVAFDTDCAEKSLLSWFQEEQALDGICIIGKYILLRDFRTDKVELITTDSMHGEVMQLVSSMLLMIDKSHRELQGMQVETPNGEEFLEPDFGAYLTFDVPYPGSSTDSDST